MGEGLPSEILAASVALRKHQTRLLLHPNSTRGPGRLCSPQASLCPGPSPRSSATLSLERVGFAPLELRCAEWWSQEAQQLLRKTSLLRSRVQLSPAFLPTQQPFNQTRGLVPRRWTPGLGCPDCGSTQPLPIVGVCSCSLHFPTRGIGPYLITFLPFRHNFVSIFLSFFLFSFCLFIYGWLCWVFVADRGLCLIQVSGGYSSLWFRGFSC